MFDKAVTVSAMARQYSRAPWLSMGPSVEPMSLSFLRGMEYLSGGVWLAKNQAGLLSTSLTAHNGLAGMAGLRPLGTGINIMAAFVPLP